MPVKSNHSFTPSALFHFTTKAASFATYSLDGAGGRTRTDTTL